MLFFPLMLALLGLVAGYHPTQLSETLPIHQNSYVSLPSQPSATNTNNYASSGYVNSPSQIQTSDDSSNYGNSPPQPPPTGNDYASSSYVLPVQPLAGDYASSGYVSSSPQPPSSNTNSYDSSGYQLPSQSPATDYVSSGYDNSSPAPPAIGINDYSSNSYIKSSPQSPTVSINNYVNIPESSKPKYTDSVLEVAFQWRFLDWVHPTVQLAGKNFTVGNPLSQDVDIDRKGRVFVTSPQWLEGTPITLSVITDLRGQGGPLLTPYPDWGWHKPDCDSLVSVYRIAVNMSGLYQKTWK